MNSGVQAGRRPFAVSLVNACLRDGRGGSPTVVVAESATATGPHAGAPPPDTPSPELSDAARSQAPARFGTSHAVFVTRQAPQAAHGAPSQEPTAGLRFFTAAGELPACGHGTVAALAFLAEHRQGTEHEFRLRVSGRVFTGRTVRAGRGIDAVFDPGPVTLRNPTSAETDLVVTALGVAADLPATGTRVASLGRARMLVPVATPEAVAALTPDLGRLRAACDQLGLLGCFVHSAPDSSGRVAARMFAPAIGVPEDIANANSTACLAAHLAGQGVTNLTVDMGDALGSPATIIASAHRSATDWKILVGGNAITTAPGSRPLAAFGRT